MLLMINDIDGKMSSRINQQPQFDLTIAYFGILKTPLKYFDQLKKKYRTRECFYLRHPQKCCFQIHLLNVFSASVSSHGELCECMCVFLRVCVCLGLKVVAAGRAQKQRTTTLNSCSNSNSSLTGTLWKAKESISIPAATIQIYIVKISHTHQHFYCLSDHENQRSRTTS